MANMKTTHPNDETKAREIFIGLARGFDNAMLVTFAAAGSGLHARPMSVAKVEDDGSLWFVTRSDTPKVDELARDSRATVIMQGSNKYLRIAGHAHEHRDREKLHELWSESFRVWFENKDDPNLVLIHVRSEEAEYWDVSGTEGVKFVLRAAKAVITGEKLKGHGDVENHAKVRL